MTQPAAESSAPPSTTPGRVEGPYAWQPDDYRATETFAHTLNTAQIEDLMQALRSAQEQRLTPGQMRRDQFLVPGLQPLFRNLASALQAGRGFMLLRGLPLDTLSDNDCKLLFWGIGLQLGMPVNQSRKLELLAEVRDVGEKVGDPTARAFRSPGALRFHTDQCDVLALMCVRGALEGGHSKIVSSATVHNALLDEAPELLAALYRPFYFSRQGEEVTGEMPYYACPIFGQYDGRLSSLFSRTFIDNAQKLAGVPPLDPTQRQALDALARLADEHSISVELRRGDVQFFNNHTIYHARTDYRDHSEHEKKRTLLRLWLTVPDGAPLPPPMRALFGDTPHGNPRGGIRHASGQRFAFDDWQAAGWGDDERARWRTQSDV
ncbi:TauD/TfdA family dioxygenase [Paraburkholderia sp. J41]|uniref:TauD/TfdA family dioxygenase n=1 Tax=Paraburkholderia sp. J41 TaxID=2805433 RepID=UPI002AC33A99|nr:TauD/TfdA family dioxygenase [Paraburkholderia sp. J41]